jgi:hypothetical protein
MAEYLAGNSWNNQSGDDYIALITKEECSVRIESLTEGMFCLHVGCGN